MSQPDLFVVCKNCGSEVSPYVTECPYCGQRVRKRAPKLDRGASPEAPPSRRRPRLPRLRPEEIEGIAPDTRPYATMALIAACLVLTVVLVAGPTVDGLGGIVLGGEDEVWRYFTAPFLHDSLGYGFVTLVAVGVFGTLLERRFGPLAPIAIFVLAGGAGSAVAVALGVDPLFGGALPVVIGANGAALGLVCAWLVEDRLAARRGADRETDLLGVYVFVAVLVLLSVAVEEANIGAALGGAAAGVLFGTALPLLARRASR